jgi:hypothetical protein
MPDVALLISSTSAGVRSTSSDPLFSSKRCSFVVLGLEQSTAFVRAATRARSVPGGIIALCDLMEQVHQRLVNLSSLCRETRDHGAEVRFVERSVFVNLACEETFAKRTEWNKIRCQFLQCRQHFNFWISPPERVLTLQRSDRLDGVRPADRLRPGLRKTKVLDLAVLDQVLHSSCHIFDWDIEVHTMLIKEIDNIGLQPFHDASATV